ncbi:hypothetical protein, partial [Klebsiella quasipneumoniae]|uniref:hypothetical protein n=1 Tax=Klebsiella quasipneumoniae TaxID=1463165 RepID=UPI00272FCEF7
VVAPFLLPESREPRPDPLDLVGVLLSLLAMGPLVLAVKLVGADGPTPGAGLAAVVGVGSAVGFVAHLRRRARSGRAPLIDPELFA